MQDLESCEATRTGSIPAIRTKTNPNCYISKNVAFLLYKYRNLLLISYIIITSKYEDT